jgi:N-carbamoylputrescine amidase
VDTSLGRLGIAICADNQFVQMPSFFHAHAVDLVLMPHAWPIPRVARGIVKAHDVREQLEHVRSLPVLYATLLGVPVVFANQTGPIARVPGVLGRLLDPAVFAMGGQSSVVDSDGILRASLDSGEGVATADVGLDPALKRLGEIPNHRGWLFPGSRVARELLMPIDIAWGRLSYTLSRSRAHTARELVRHVAKEFSGTREEM